MNSTADGRRIVHGFNIVMIRSWMYGRDSRIFSLLRVGWTRFESRTMWQFFSRSHQTEVPVKPRCPTECGEKYLPLADLLSDGVSQPRAKLESSTALSRERNS